jgi:hypothetical protein
MTDFADVEQFARQHAGCGGLTPSAIPQATGGFTLTLTCACGARFDRRVTAEEATQPLPPIQLAPRPAPTVARPSAPASPPAKPASPAPVPSAPSLPSSPRSRRAAERPRVEPSRELEEAMRAALEAETQTVERPASAPPPKPADKGVSRGDLEALMREALAADEAAAAEMAAPPARPSAAPPSGTGSTSRPRAPVTRLDLDLTIREALDKQRADAAEPREVDEDPSVTRRKWLAIAGVAVLGVVGGGAYWFLGDSSEDDDAPPAASNTPQMPPEQRTAFEDVVKSLRLVQSSTPPDSTVPVYASRVLVARGDVEKFSQSTAPTAAKTSAREFMELHQLANATLRSRSLDRTDTFEVLSRDPTLTLCPEVKGVLDRAMQTSNLSPDDAKVAAVSAALPKIWECARARLTALERALSGPPR